VVKTVPRADWEVLCRRGLILNQDHQAASASDIVRARERYLRKEPDVVEPEVNGGIEILHEDEALIVLNKPAPLPMHSAGRFNRNTLQHILNLAYHPQKPHPAHRLDANTTGIVLVTRTRHFAARLQPQFERGQVGKVYLVRVRGEAAQDVFSCDLPIGSEPGEAGSRDIDLEAGLAAHTDFRVLERATDGTTLLEARPRTGRTNQIRVHLWQMGLPVCGDPTYLPDKKIGEVQTLRPGDPPLCLHAWRIAFRHPLHKERVEFCAPVPAWARTGTIEET
jgi:UPF0176 protein